MTHLSLEAVRPPVELEELRDRVRQFLATELAAGNFTPRANAWQTGWDPGFTRKLAEQGWLGMTFPPVYGGSGAGALARFVVTEELLAAGAPVAAHWIADRQSGPAILRFGSEEQKQFYLPGIARGEIFFAIGMSEPDAGSDLASVRTQARQASGGWLLSGTKVWSSGAHLAHTMIVLARTSTRNDLDRHAGLSQFLVDLTSAGVSTHPIRLLNGEHHFNEVVFNEVFVPESRVLGRVGNGWRQVTGELALERSGPERILSSYPLLVAFLRHVQEHPGFTVDPAPLGSLFARLWALRAMSFSVATRMKSGYSPEVEAAVVKDLGTRFEGIVIDTVRRLAAVEPDPESTDSLSRMLAEAVLHLPSFTLRGGTNEILRGVIAKHLGTR